MLSGGAGGGGANVGGGGGGGGGPGPCLVCQMQPSSILAQPCNHCALCYTCAAHTDECPICRATIVHKTSMGPQSLVGVVGHGGGGGSAGGGGMPRL